MSHYDSQNSSSSFPSSDSKSSTSSKATAHHNMDHWPALPIEPCMPLTGLQLFFLHDERRPRPQDIPKLSPTLLGRALNCVHASEGNNDLLEFVGDRVLNFYTAEFVNTFKITRAHSAVSRALCHLRFQLSVYFCSLGSR